MDRFAMSRWSVDHLHTAFFLLVACLLALALPAAALPKQPEPETEGKIGCFKDPNNPFDLDGHLVRSATNTPKACIETCRTKGFAYAGVQYGQSCLCGNSYGKFGPANNCDMACTGDPSQTCGGINSNMVYSTGIVPPGGTESGGTDSGQ